MKSIKNSNEPIWGSNPKISGLYRSASTNGAITDIELTDWILKLRRNVFTARYEMNL
jgi:hypothetical protein